MPLLLWAIKGKWERDVQIPLAILTCILSNGIDVAAWTDYNHMVETAKASRHPTWSSREGSEQRSDKISCWPALACYVWSGIPFLPHNAGSTSLSGLKSYEIFPPVFKAGTPGDPSDMKSKREVCEIAVQPTAAKHVPGIRLANMQLFCWHYWLTGWSTQWRVWNIHWATLLGASLRCEIKRGSVAHNVLSGPCSLLKHIGPLSKMPPTALTPPVSLRISFAMI